MRADTMQMKFMQLGKRLLAAATVAGMSLLIASCGPSNTVDFLYATSNRGDPGNIDVYQVDSLSGALSKLPDSPYPSGGRNPVYDVTSPNGLNLYVANHDDNIIVHFAIGTDGKLYPLQSVTTPGTEPVALAMNSAGTALYVLDYYAPAAPGQPSFTDLNPGPGAVIVYPIDSNGNMGAALSVGAADYWSVQCFPSNLTATPDGKHLYVTNTNAIVVTSSPPVTGTVPILPAQCPASGTVSAFTVQSTGSSSSQDVTGLSAVAGSPFPTGGGSQPTGIVSDTSSGWVYVTDSNLNEVYSYAVQPGGGISLADTVPTGTMPMDAIVYGTSPSPEYLYISNFADGSISSYSLNSGRPTAITTTDSGSSGPLCMIIDPDMGRFFFTADYTGNMVGGMVFNPANGSLITSQLSPYPGSGQPTCVAAAPQKYGRHNGL